MALYAEATTSTAQPDTRFLENQVPRTTEVLLPDMFKSFLRDEPRLHPDYAAVKASSEDWVIKFCSLSPRATKKVRQCDFTYYCAVVYADAPLEKFRVVSDWGNWVFPFDDMFDEGELRGDSEAAHEMMDCLMSKMLSLPYHGQKPKLVQAHDMIFDQLCQKSSPETIQRYIKAMEDYRDSVLMQVDSISQDTVPRLDDMLEVRSRSIAGWAMYVMIEYAHGLDIPSAVFDHPVIKELEVTVFKMIAIVNDIVSYPKEEADGVRHNMIAICRMRGLSAQGAFDTVGALLNEQLLIWDNKIRELPSWGSRVDSHLERYVEGARNMGRANIRSSFRAERYFGREAARVQQTRRISVLTEPTYIN
ncbi:Sesquiterpene cyclase BOT2 [Cladobotryum mycophilum]|uniref:Terpene synthase n=1 Tax=Cladobotryum mycophilum TaxID=491253 RepID=A0ABR0SB53_9HYPO